MSIPLLLLQSLVNIRILSAHQERKEKKKKKQFTGNTHTVWNQSLQTNIPENHSPRKVLITSHGKSSREPKSQTKKKKEGGSQESNRTKDNSGMKPRKQWEETDREGKIFYSYFFILFPAMMRCGSVSSRICCFLFIYYSTCSVKDIVYRQPLMYLKLL